jgi:hypothetical protein
MNTDAEWNDSRHALCAMVLTDAYARTGAAEYFERGVAALRACFTLMVAPENREVSPLTYSGRAGRFKHRLLLEGPDPRAFTDADRIPNHEGAYYPLGYSSENYGHVGGDLPSGRPGFDWAEGLYLTSAAWVRRRYGDVYVDLGRRRAFGINGATARWAEGEIVVEERLGIARELEVAFEGDLPRPPERKLLRKSQDRVVFAFPVRAHERIAIPLR